MWTEVHWQEVRKEGRETLSMEALYSQNVRRHSSQDLGADLSGAPPSVSNPALSGGHEVLCQIQLRIVPWPIFKTPQEAKDYIVTTCL